MSANEGAPPPRVLLSGFNEKLTAAMETLQSQQLESVSLYLRGHVATTAFERQTQQWVKRLTTAGEAGVLLRVANGRVLVVEVSERQGGLWFQDERASGSLRFQVEPFSVVRIVHGPVPVALVLEYLERVKHRIYSEDSATRPRDFAVELVQWVETGSKTRVTDLAQRLVDASLGAEYPPRTRAPRDELTSWCLLRG